MAWASFISAALGRSEPALSLAALRVVVPAMVLVSPGYWEGKNIASWDPARWVVPEGLGFLVAALPINAHLATAAQILVAFCALSAIVGIRARLALAGLTLSAFYLLSIAQLSGFVWHDMHLLWMCALLSASPCADVLAVDARRPLSAEGPEYRPAVLGASLLLGAIYFFPGYHKLATSGLDWALSDNLRNQLYFKWMQHGRVPAFRIDQFPWLLKGGGLFVMAFELAFPFLVLFRRTRAIAAALGLLFHLLSQLIFKIPFMSLWICYVALVDLRPGARWAVARSAWLKRALEPGAPGSSVSPRWPTFALTLVLFPAAVVQGARGQMQSYPFACYPTFQWRASSQMPDLKITRVSGEAESEVAHARSARGYRSQRQWGEVWRLAGVWGDVKPERLRAYYSSVTRRNPAHTASKIRFYRVYRRVAPEHWGEPPARSRLLLEVPAAAN